MSNPCSIQILFVERNEEVKLTLRNLLSKITGLDLAAEASNASEALVKLQGKNIDVVLLDLGLADTAGIELTKQIRKLNPNVRVLIFTASDKPEDIFAALDAGADGYVLKSNLSNVLETAIRSVRLGAVWLDPGIASQVLDAIQSAPTHTDTRILPTGIITLPLRAEEKSILTEVAASNCSDGVCLVDPSFIRKLRRFSTTSV